jgi:hypothetical protein
MKKKLYYFFEDASAIWKYQNKPDFHRHAIPVSGFGYFIEKDWVDQVDKKK